MLIVKLSVILFFVFSIALPNSIIKSIHSKSP